MKEVTTGQYFSNSHFTSPLPIGYRVECYVSIGDHPPRLRTLAITGNSQSRETMRRFTFTSRQFHAVRGTTVVETALVLPVFLLFVLGLIELAHAQMVKNVLRSACRSAARLGTTDGRTTADVRERALQILKSAVDESDVQIFVKDASSFDSGGVPPESGSDLEALPNIELADAEPRQLFLVRAKIHYNDVAIVPNIPYLGSFLDDVVLEGQAFMRHE